MPHDPLPGDAFSEPPDTDGVSPLSAFFPTVTPEEAKHVDGETFAIMERRTKVIALYGRGRSVATIVQLVGCSRATAYRDIHDVLEGYKRIAMRSAQEHIADALLRNAARMEDVEAEWEKSKGERIETSSSKRGDHGTAAVKKKQGYGDPRLAALLIKLEEMRCKLLGLLRPEDLKNAAIAVPTKYVAGLDPAEAV